MQKYQDKIIDKLMAKAEEASGKKGKKKKKKKKKK